MLRWVALAAIIAGFPAGALFPSPAGGSGPTGHTIVPILTPPTLGAGSSPLLTCGWHEACTGASSGIALDWDDTPADTRVFFRGFFARTNTPTATLALWAQPTVNRGGNYECEIKDVWIIEVRSGKLKAVPRYMHIDLTTTSRFNIYTQTFGYWHNIRIGNTTQDDSVGCDWFGSHAHEMDIWTASGVMTTRNTGLYPTSETCRWPEVTRDCRYFRNDVIDNWTRKFQWAEGS